MPYRCSKKFRFEAAHALTQLPPEHKCHNVHGHGYEVTITFESPHNLYYGIPHLGMVVDFGDISGWWKRDVEPLLDHRNLNAVPELGEIHLTAEGLAKWIFDRCNRAFWRRGLCSIRVQETPTCWAEYIRDDERRT